MSNRSFSRSRNLSLAALAATGVAANTASAKSTEFSTEETNRLGVMMKGKACVSTVEPGGKHEIGHLRIYFDSTPPNYDGDPNASPFVRVELYGKDGYLMSSVWGHNVKLGTDGVQLIQFKGSTRSTKVSTKASLLLDLTKLETPQATLFDISTDSDWAQEWGMKDIPVVCFKDGVKNPM